MLTIGILASTRIIAVTPDTYARDAAVIMNSLRISCLLVTHKREPLGILTERDLVLAASRIIGFADLQVRDIMSAPALTAPMTTPFNSACRLLLENGIRHLMLLDGDGDIEGVVTPTDLLRAPGFERCLGDRQVEEAMNRQVITAREQDTARYALARLAEDRAGVVVVVEQGRPVGIITDRDAAGLLVQGDEILNGPLTRFMGPLVTVSPQVPLREAVAVMHQNRIRKLVVVDADGLLLGIFGQGSLLTLLGGFCGGQARGEQASACGFVENGSACSP
jgi:CBS domain-containing protein